ETARLVVERERDSQIVRASQDLVEICGPAQEREPFLARARHVAPDRADLHVEGAGASAQRLTDPPIAKDAERLPRQLGPRRRRARAHTPLAFPDAAP